MLQSVILKFIITEQIAVLPSES